MSKKKQTRRSISLRGSTYFDFRAVCAAEERAMSDVLEELIAAHVEGKVRVETPLRKKVPEPPPPPPRPLYRPDPRTILRIAARRRSEAIQIRAELPSKAKVSQPVAPKKAEIPRRQNGGMPW